MDSLQSPSVDWLPPDMEDGLRRPNHLELSSVDPDYLDDLEGTVTREGNLVLFVAEDLEAKIKLSSPKNGEDMKRFFPPLSRFSLFTKAKCSIHNFFQLMDLLLVGQEVPLLVYFIILQLVLNYHH